MADREEAINCIQDLIDVANCHGSACVYKHNGGVERLENVLACLTEGQKSADEMFRECGYQRVNPGCSFVTREYVKRDWYICVDEDGIIRFGPSYDMTGLEHETILACAQLIKEMEADHGTE